MKKIEFTNKEGKRILCFDNFILSTANETPYLYEADLHITIDSIKLDKRIEGSEGDLFGLSSQLKKILYKNYEKINFFISVDESLKMIFEVINSSTISIALESKEYYSDVNVEFKCKFEIYTNEIPFIISQVEELSKERGQSNIIDF